MSTLFDARTNEITGGLLDQIGGQTISDARSASATLGALNAEILMDLQGKAVALFDIRSAAMNATLVFEGTVDGTNYFTLPAWQVTDEALTAAVVITTTNAQAYVVGCSGFRRVRCRVSVYSSGSAVVAARASSADFAIYSRPQPSRFNVSLAPAANTGGTITLPAAGAGLFHYITGFQLTVAMNPATAQTGAAPVFCTTTNLPGAPAWAIPIVGNTAASTGGFGAALAVIADMSWGNPLKATAANTNTTFVLPAPGAACSLRANVQYYVGA